MADENVNEQVELGKSETEDTRSEYKYAVVEEKTTDNPVDTVEMKCDDGDLQTSAVCAENMTDTMVSQEDGEHESATNATIKVEETVGETDFPVISENSGIDSARSILTSSILKNKVQSRYLRASTGSCHDFCKFGLKHDLEEKSRAPLWKVILEGRAQVKAQNAAESEKNRSRGRRLSFPRTKAEKANALAIQGTDLPSGDAGEPKIESRSNRRISSPPIVPENLMPGGSSLTKTGKRAGVPPLNPVTCSSQKIKDIKLKKDVRNCTMGKERSVGTPRTSVSSKPAVKKAVSMNVRLYSNLKGSSSAKNQIPSEEAKVMQPEDVPEKTLYMIEPSGEEKTTESAEATGNSKKVQRARKGSTLISKSKSERSSNKGSHTVLLSPSVSSIPSKSKRSTLPESSQSGQGVQGRSGLTKSRKSDANLKNGKPKSIIKPRAKADVEQKTKGKKVGPSQSGDKDGSIWKLKFRRGAVITLPTISNTPRRLKFKKRSVLEGNQPNVNAAAGSTSTDNSGHELPTISNTPRRLKFKRSVLEGNHPKVNAAAGATSKDITGHEPHESANAELERVKLRHQEAERKQNDVNLNNVIEETAGKLVQSRKSKVKALVGAFESVMSLRERKRMAAPSAS